MGKVLLFKEARYNECPSSPWKISYCGDRPGNEFWPTGCWRKSHGFIWQRQDFLASLPKFIDQGCYMIHMMKLQDGVFIGLEENCPKKSFRPTWIFAHRKKPLSC